jgi:RNA 2',3'-cyclic 3'-phosphodiesterase
MSGSPLRVRATQERQDLMRLFVAADLDGPSREACDRVGERLREQGWPGRWVAPENYHLTVAFLGSVDPARLPDVLRALQISAPRASPFDVPLDTVGAFPNARRPRVVWVGPGLAVPAFGALCGVVRHELAALGFTFEPHADAHVTLARAAGPTVVLPSVDPPSIPPLHIAALTLYQSFTERTGARYVALERYPLLPAS